MSQAAKTLEGWYCLHDFRTVDWTTWKMLPRMNENPLSMSFRVC